MKILLTALAGAALLAAPLTASAEAFHGGAHFAGPPARFAPAHFGPGPVARGGFRGGPGYFRGPGYMGGAWAVGAFLPALYWDAYLSDPFDYGLAPAPYGAHWVVVDGEALLIQNGTGAVLQVAPL